MFHVFRLQPCITTITSGSSRAPRQCLLSRFLCIPMKIAIFFNDEFSSSIASLTLNLCSKDRSEEKYASCRSLSLFFSFNFQFSISRINFIIFFRFFVFSGIQTCSNIKHSENTSALEFYFVNGKCKLQSRSILFDFLRCMIRSFFLRERIFSVFFFFIFSFFLSVQKWKYVWIFFPF